MVCSDQLFRSPKYQIAASTTAGAATPSTYQPLVPRTKTEWIAPLYAKSTSSPPNRTGTEIMQSTLVSGARNLRNNVLTVLVDLGSESVLNSAIAARTAINSPPRPPSGNHE